MILSEKRTVAGKMSMFTVEEEKSKVSTLRSTALKKGGQVHKLSVESSYKVIRESVDLTEYEEQKDNE